MTVRVQYAIPARQLFLAVGIVFATVGGIAVAALTLPSVGQAMFAAFLLAASMIWVLIKNTSATGDATLEAGELVIEPRRRSLCVAGGTIRIPWTDIERVQSGATGAGRTFTILRTRQPARSWILTPKNSADFAFHPELLDRTNAARARADTEPLEARDAYDSRGWRIGAVAALMLFAAGITGTLLAGKAGDLSVWVRVAAIGCFAIPLAERVFRSWRRG